MGKFTKNKTKTMAHVCNKCGKKYVRQDYFEKHLLSCILPEEEDNFMDADEEQFTEFNEIQDDQLSEEFEEVAPAPAAKPVKRVSPDERRKVDIVMSIIAFFKDRKAYPMDAHARYEVITLYNEYYSLDVDPGCDDCNFDDYYQSLWRIYASHK